MKRSRPAAILHSTPPTEDPTARRSLLIILAGASACGAPKTRPPEDALQPSACGSCHQAIVDSYLGTAHFATSAIATAASIKGSFDSTDNVLQTRVPWIRFTMERRADGFYQRAVDRRQDRSHAERMDLVIGSGRKGQTYLTWRSGLLFELPVSYLSAPHRWINSPGYQDGTVDFSRMIPPRCLECHATRFDVVRVGQTLRYSNRFTLGITCAKCHGDAHQHVAYHQAHPEAREARFILNPDSLSRARQLDVCGLCHSGPRRLIQPPFSFQPGDELDAFLGPVPSPDSAAPDVHGNEIGLVERTPCFRASPGLTCTTCHDVHRPERDVGEMSRKCQPCHSAAQHPKVSRTGAALSSGCVDCHMPNEPSRGLEVSTAKGRQPIYYRSHAIAVYPDSVATSAQRQP